MDRQSVPVSSFSTLSPLSLGLCCASGRAWSPVRRDRREDSTRRTHRDRRSHAQEKAERVKGIADLGKALQLQLCAVAAAPSQGHPSLCSPGGGVLVCAESLPCLGRGEGSAGGSAGGSAPERDLCPQCHRGVDQGLLCSLSLLGRFPLV